MRVRWRRVLIGGGVIAVLAWGAGYLERRPERLGRAGRAGEGAGAYRSGAPDSTQAEIRTVRLYFASPGGDNLVGEIREVTSASGLHGQVESLVRELALGARRGGVSLLPPGTAVRHVYLDQRGLMTLDLTPAFRDRFRGGSTAEYLTMASLVYTLLDNQPGVRQVRIACAGEVLPTLGGHFACDGPFGRSDL